MTTLKEKMAADVASVFLDTDAFADSITWYPQGDMNAGQTVAAIVDCDKVEGNNMVPGDGQVLHHERKKGLRLTGRVEISRSITITEAPHPRPDKFGIDGKTWTVKRVEGYDDDMQTVVIVRPIAISTSRGQHRG